MEYEIEESINLRSWQDERQELYAQKTRHRRNAAWAQRQSAILIPESEETIHP